MEPFEGTDVLPPGAAEAENTAAEDQKRSREAGQLVQRRHPESCVGNALPAPLDHVGRYVASVDVEASVAQRVRSLPAPQPASKTGLCKCCSYRSSSGVSRLTVAQ